MKANPSGRRHVRWAGVIVGLITIACAQSGRGDEISLPLKYEPTLLTTETLTTDPGTRRELLTIKIRAGAHGEVASIAFEANTPLRGPDAIEQLRKMMAQIIAIGRGAGQPAPEIALKIDNGLRYEFVIRAIEAVSYVKDAKGFRVPLAAGLRLQTENFGDDVALPTRSTAPAMTPQSKPPVTVKPGAIIVKP